MVEIVGYPHISLSTPARAVVDFDHALRTFIDAMAEAMYSASGVGLAAPQVNVSQRIVLIDSTGGEEANGLVTMINPCVTWCSGELSADLEGCLSLPGMRLNVVRHVAVNVEYHDVMGQLQKTECTGYFARIVQHEIDHLNGFTMLDQVGPMTRRLALRDMGMNK